LVYFMFIWHIFPVLVCCTKKNLATRNECLSMYVNVHLDKGVENELFGFQSLDCDLSTKVREAGRSVCQPNNSHPGNSKYFEFRQKIRECFSKVTSPQGPWDKKRLHFFLEWPFAADVRSSGILEIAFS
jgi:hypothetical protein